MEPKLHLTEDRDTSGGGMAATLFAALDSRRGAVGVEHAEGSDSDGDDWD